MKQIALYSIIYQKTKNTFKFSLKVFYKVWPHLGSNQGLADYESATLTN